MSTHMSRRSVSSCPLTSMPRVGLFDANGLVGKADEILDFANTQRIDGFFIVETWLNENSSTAILRPFLHLTQVTNQIIFGGRRA